MVKRKNRILTNSLRTINKMFSRFLSLLIISFLGTFAFVGLQSTAPNMLDTLDIYLDVANIYDIKIVSSLGLVDEDIEEIEKLEGIKEVEGSYSKDVLMSVSVNEYVVNITSIPKKINNIDLLEGKLPSNINEIVVEKNMLIKNKLSIGDFIEFNDSAFKENKLEIVGVIDSHLYFSNVDLSQNRGTTTIGAGTINYYSYVIDEVFNLDYYTSIYVIVDNAKEEITSKKEYNEKIKDVLEKINSIKKERETIRYNEILFELENQINELELNIKTQLDQIEIKIKELEEKIQKINNEIIQVERQLDNAYIEYENLLFELNISESNIENRISELEELLSSTSVDSPNYEQYLTEYQKLLNIKEKQNEINSLEEEYSNLLTKKNLNETIYELNILGYEKCLNSFKKRIEEARLSLDKIPEVNWFIFDRNDHLTYLEYIEDTSSIESLAKIFPVIFFAVAILISLVSMNRMVEDDRLEIGTLKSMGYSNKHIIIKYLLFAFLATLIGGSLGCILGSIIIPNIIYSIYSMLFTLSSLYLNIEWIYYILGLGITFICVLLTTYITVIKVLKEKPSELMRPKAPKSGRRVFLEKFRSIWDKLSFSNKVTIRNLFRYKRRVVVTILGVMGCTALMMCGFGVKDSIVDIPERQFGRVFTFDAMVYVSDYDQKNDKYIFENDKINSTIQVQNINTEVNGRKTTMFVIDSSQNLDKFVNLYDFKTGEKKSLEENKIVISQKLAELENIKVGDTLEFNDKNNILYEYEVASIVENYMEHYIFISDAAYKLSGQEFIPNTICIQTSYLNEKDRIELKEELLENSKVISISYVSELIEKVSNMIKSLDKVVLILIVLASLLSFVVLYNLSCINIHERKREIATLKVLGFYNKEVDHYITKENTFLSFLGIIFGLFIGYFLAIYVIKTVEIEKGKFILDIKFTSYLYSTILTIIFTIMINGITHYLLKRINMIESLKSVE